MEAGSKLGPYEIIAPIGAGGMGEVYRARDVRVNRDVAIKILPPELAEDAARLARFEQEARATAALNHPNLLTIHDVGRAGERPYIVFELLEGKTLRELMGDSENAPVPGSSGATVSPRKALRYGIQIANGLAAAHDRGVIHRDLKPENIVVTSDGRLKILDFGLALVPSCFEAGFEEADTMRQVTDPGVVMGTVGYMSPEQIRGQELDARTDIFSFGVVLYELLVGARPFRGMTAADVMSQILTGDPPELDRLGGVRALVERCLEKDREERFRSAHDLALALEAISESSRSSPVVPVFESDSPAWRLRWLIPAAAVLAIAAVILLGIREAGVGAPEPDSPSLQQLTYRSGSEWFPALAPDGDSFVFVADGGGDDDLWLQRVGGENAINLTAGLDSDETQPAFSPDGQSIAFRSSRGEGGIWVMGATGESVRRLTDFGFNPSWAPDGRTLVVADEGVADPEIRSSSRSSLWRIDATSGAAEPIETGMDAVQPSWSPDGRWIAFWGLPDGTGRRVIAIVPAGGGEPRIVVDDGYQNWNPVWIDAERLVFVSDRAGAMNFWAIGIDERVGEPTGPPAALTTAAQWQGQANLAAGGTALAFVIKTQKSSVDLIPFDLERGVSAAAETRLRTSRDVWSAAPSPDGEFLVLKAVDRHEDLFLATPAGEIVRRLTDDRFKTRWPAWSAGGDRIFFFSDRAGRYEIWSIRPDGSGLTRETYSSADGPVYPEPSPDGRTLLVTYFSSGSMKNALIDLSQPAEQREPEYLPSIAQGREMFTPRWAPDGKTLGGAVRSADGAMQDGIWIWNRSSGAYRQVSEKGSLSAWIDPDRMLVRDEGRFYVLQISDGGRRDLGPVPEGYLSFALSADESALYGVANEVDTDIWLLDLGGAAR